MEAKYKTHEVKCPNYFEVTFIFKLHFISVWPLCLGFFPLWPMFIVSFAHHLCGSCLIARECSPERTTDRYGEKESWSMCVSPDAVFNVPAAAAALRSTA